MKINEKKLINYSENSSKKKSNLKQKNVAKNISKKNKNYCNNLTEKSDENISEKISENNDKILSKNYNKNLIKINRNFKQKKLNKTPYKYQNIFINDEINLSNKANKKEFLISLTKALYSLSHSSVYSGKLGLGGKYHKNYYCVIEEEFLKDKSEIFYLKNTTLKVFLLKIMLNMCNYGIYFYDKNENETYLKICCGNGFVLSKTQQNYVEKFINEHINFKN